MPDNNLKSTMETTRASIAQSAIMKMAPKSAPDSLAEDIENAQFQAGAYLFRVEKNGTIKYATNKFILTGANFALKERVQLTEAFNSSNISFFDESVRVYVFNGVATDYFSSDSDVSKYFSQSSIIMGYNDLFRGSKLFAEEAVCVMRFMNHTIYCYPYALSVSYSSSADKMAQFQLTAVVVSHDLEWAGVVNNTQLKDLVTVGSTKYDNLVTQITNILSLNDPVLLKELNGIKVSHLMDLVNTIDTDFYSNAFKERLKSMIGNFIENLKSFNELQKFTDSDTEEYDSLIILPESNYLQSSTFSSLNSIGRALQVNLQREALSLPNANLRTHDLKLPKQVGVSTFGLEVDPIGQPVSQGPRA